MTVQVFGDALELAAYRDIARTYEARTGRSVRVVGIADRDSHLAKLTTSFSAGRPPDVFLLSSRNYGPFSVRDVLEPAGPRLRDSEVLRPADFFDVSLRAFTQDGTLQCLPVNAAALAIFVNRRLLAAARVATPRGGWTFDEFFRAALRLRAHTRGAGGRARAHAAGVDPDIAKLAAFVWTAGGEIVDDEVAPNRFTLDTPAARRGVDRFLSLYRESLVPTENAVEAEPLAVQFREGRIGMLIASRRDLPTFRDAPGLDWEAVPFPRAENQATVLQSDGLCLARGQRAQAAWDFVEFAAGVDGQRRLAEAGRIVPALRAAAASPEFRAADGEPSGSQVFLDALATVRPLPSTANWPRIEDSASLAFKRAFYAEVTGQEAIDRVNAETQGLF